MLRRSFTVCLISVVALCLELQYYTHNRLYGSRFCYNGLNRLIVVLFPNLCEDSINKLSRQRIVLQQKVIYTSIEAHGSKWLCWSDDFFLNPLLP